MPEKTGNADNRITHLFSGFLYTCDINNRNLQRILNDNKHTEFGEKCKFADISSAEEFAEAVPVAEYDDFKAYIQRMYSGEDNVLTVYPVRNFILSSGTKGTVKRFPLTEESLRRYSSYIVDMPMQLIEADSQKMIHTSVFRPAGELGEALLSSAYYSYLDSNGQLPEYLGGRRLLFSEMINDVPYVKLRIMLAYRDISAIHSIFLYDVLLLLRYLETNSDMLLDDIQNGSISVDLPQQIKEQISRLPRVDDDRISELRAILKDGLDASTLTAIWSNIRYISGIGGPAYEAQTRILKKYTGDIPIYYFAYASSEVMAGVAIEADKAEYALLPQSAYYEFIPADCQAPVMMDQLAAGGIYEPVVTTFSGLYRYRTGDLIRIIRFEGHTPVFEILGRRNDVFNIAGEKIDAASMQEAVKTASEGLSEIGDFCIAADYEVIPARLHIFAETGADRCQLAEELDRNLRALSADYDDIRGLGMLEMPRATCLQNGAISHAFFNQNSHSKPKLFLTQKQYEQLKSEVSAREAK